MSSAVIVETVRTPVAIRPRGRAGKEAPLPQAGARRQAPVRRPGPARGRHRGEPARSAVVQLAGQRHRGGQPLPGQPGLAQSQAWRASSSADSRSPGSPCTGQAGKRRALGRGHGSARPRSDGERAEQPGYESSPGGPFAPRRGHVPIVPHSRTDDRGTAAPRSSTKRKPRDEQAFYQAERTRQPPSSARWMPLTPSWPRRWSALGAPSPRRCVTGAGPRGTRLAAGYPPSGPG